MVPGTIRREGRGRGAVRQVLAGRQAPGHFRAIGRPASPIHRLLNDRENLPLHGVGAPVPVRIRSQLFIVSLRRIPAGRDLTVTAKVTSTGAIEADEVVQVYLSDLESSVRIPRWQLAGFSRVRLQPGRSATVTFTLTPRQMSLIDERGSRLLEPGRFRVYVGGSQPDSRSAALTGVSPLSAEFSVTGDEVRLP